MSSSHHAPPPEFDSVNGDSLSSTPRSENHHHNMYDDTQPRARFMCSFGGKIMLRPHDNQLRYVGGDTRIVAVNRHTTFASLLGKLSKLAGNSNINIKYQLPNEDLDALITVTTDEDLENMMEEYDRLSQNQKSARLRLFLFPNDSSSRASTISSILDGSSKREQWFVDALNGGSGSGTGLERGRSEASSIVSEVPDYLFGLDNSDESKFVKNRFNISDPGSPAPPIVSSPYGSVSSSMAPMPDLPPVKTKPDNPNPVTESRETPVGEKTVQPSYPGSPLWRYPAQPVPVYYVPGPGQVQPGNVAVQSIPMRAPFVHPFPVAPNQLPVGYPPVSSMGQVYSGLRPALSVDPNEGMNQGMYYGVRNSGVVPGYGGEEMQGPGTDGKAGRVSQ
ncbi:protein PAL OF QUIRKY [Lycium ferocissimum]|uniref:protein PAL OF QUIRKY n=1 Tax=Lycium ferocissimum TaxID=112874 RepID=UPI002815CCCD|nr:protein PAL OF QUIRKY [Lycium ferocissimum]XP_059292806.1 protein PAL OF QUIRKY [Lycium ferocissimum]